MFIHETLRFFEHLLLHVIDLKVEHSFLELNGAVRRGQQHLPGSTSCNAFLTLVCWVEWHPMTRRSTEPYLELEVPHEKWDALLCHECHGLHLGPWQKALNTSQVGQESRVKRG